MSTGAASSSTDFTDASSVTAFVDGVLVSVAFDGTVDFSSCPASWSAGSPSHVTCSYPDGFSFSGLLRFKLSGEVSCFVLGRDWINAERLARRGEFFFFYSILHLNNRLFFICSLFVLSDG